MPNRMIKDTLRTSRNVSSLSDFEFRVWVLLITYVDDYGRGSADPELLKGLLFPRMHGVTEDQIGDALRTLSDKGMITLYESEGEPFFCFPKWGEHQRIRTKVSKFPQPPTICRGLPQSAAICREVRPETKPNQTKKKPEEKPSEYRTREDDQDDGFGEFWKIYPRKTGEIRGAYLEYVHALETGATPEILMEALSWQAEEWKDEGQPQYIPSAEKWLKNRRWEEKRREKKPKPKSNSLAEPLEPVGTVDLSQLEQTLARI